jgi:hypothetical protein
MVQLDASRKPQTPELHKVSIDFIVAIDHSSSMRMNDKLAHVKATIQFLIEQLTESHRFCLLEFNHEVNRVTEGLLEMTKENKQIVLDNLKKIKPEGSTNISDALMTAINILKSRPSAESTRISSVMLFTDGLANAGLRGQKLVQEVNAMQIPTGLTINTFGYGVDHDSKMLQNLSFCSKGGVYYYIETTNSIAATFGECLAGILSTVAHNVNLRLIGADGCRLVSFYTKFPIIEHKSVKDYTISLGSLYSEESRSVLFKLSIKKLAETMDIHELLTVKLTYTNTLTGQDVSLMAPVQVARPKKVDLYQQLPIDLDKHINRYTAAVAMEEAAAKASMQDFSGAQKQLQDVIKLVQQSVSARNTVSRQYCEDLVADLQEVANGMEDEQAYAAGIHYVHAYSTMYYMERSTGTANLLGIERDGDGKKGKKRSVGYGYKTKEQEEISNNAVSKQQNYVSGYLSSN